MLKKKIWPSFQKFYKIWVWDPGSEINLFRIPNPGPGIKKAPDPGSATLVGGVYRFVQFFTCFYLFFIPLFFRWRSGACCFACTSYCWLHSTCSSAWNWTSNLCSSASSWTCSSSWTRPSSSSSWFCPSRYSS
jgi:hypothetical protein